jgi:polar amino acid transport system substrate-binding protein
MSRVLRRTSILAATAATVLALAATACGSSPASGPTSVATSAGSVSPAAADSSAAASVSSPPPASINLSANQDRITTDKVDSIAQLVPADIRARGTLVVTGSIGTAPPLGFYADDDTTIIGSEPDLAHLFGDVLGLKVEYRNADWAQNFVQIDSGAADAFISNVTVTEERKEKYDFATYRLDNLAFEAKKGSGLKIGTAADAAGKKIGVGSGTNQEKILVDWSEADVKAGLPAIEISYYQNASDYYLALGSGRIDAYFGPNPTSAYHVLAAGETEIVGTQSGAGADLQGEIAVLTKKGNGLAGAFAAAIDHTIENGTYAQVLARGGLTNESVAKSEINPPGLPKTES